ncbi:putative sgs1 protein, partial [Rhizophagus irregularis]
LLLTATCFQDDVEIICQNLNINSVNFNVIRSSCFSRPEIEYEVKKKSTREKNLIEITKIIDKISDGQCIIYCSSPGMCNEILPLLRDKLKETAIGAYHGGLESSERDHVMLQWKSQHLKVMIATNAFGLGVNSPNVRSVIHYTFPSSISNFIQESGRAGRDGNSAQSILFYSRNDIKTIYTIITGGRER